MTFKNPKARSILGIHPLPARGSAAKPSEAPSTTYTGTINTTARVKEQASKEAESTGFGKIKSRLAAVAKEGRGSFRAVKDKANEYAERRSKKHGRLTEAELKSAKTYEERKSKAEAADREQTERAERARRMARRNKQ